MVSKNGGIEAARESPSSTVGMIFVIRWYSPFLPSWLGSILSPHWLYTWSIYGLAEIAHRLREDVECMFSQEVCLTGMGQSLHPPGTQEVKKKGTVHCSIH
jgi:hypothetical protein